VTERTGTLRVLGADGALSQPLAGVPEVDARGQGGLLDISLAPDFAASRRIYFTFAEPRGDQSNSTALARAQLSPDRLRIDNVEVIFQQQPAWRSALHFGSNIEWTADGNLFLALGERSMPAARTLSQDLSTHLGKVVRLTPDGAPAPGNPFLGRDDARPEIWSYGHRNIQGAAFDASGKLWTIEHGPRGGDELNAPEAGKNYGWPVISYGIEYAGGQIGDGATARAGMEQPVYYWDPVIAPGDMTFYAGDLFPWRGDLLIASLNPGGLVRLEIEDGRVVGEERLIRDAGRVRDVVEAPDGSLIVITDERDGKVLRLRPRA
jgi:glucose/arabinose dehydrogenase